MQFLVCVSLFRVVFQINFNQCDYMTLSDLSRLLVSVFLFLINHSWHKAEVKNSHWLNEWMDYYGWTLDKNQSTLSRNNLWAEPLEAGPQLAAVHYNEPKDSQKMFFFFTYVKVFFPLFFNWRWMTKASAFCLFPCTIDMDSLLGLPKVNNSV